MSDIDALIAELNKKHKVKIVQRGTELRKFEMIPFSSPKLNYLTRGGIAKGHIAEFFGAEQGGKTTTALDLLANFQKTYPEELAVYLDAENTLDVEWGELLGVDWDKVVLIKPEAQYAETLLEMVLDCIKAGGVGLVIIDSIPFLLSKQALENDLEQKTYAGNSGVMTVFAQKVVPMAAKANCTVVCINQVRDMLGVQYKAYNTPGGRALKHAYLQRLFFSKGSLLNEKGEEVANNFENPTGHIVNVKYEKNKVTANDRRLGNYTLNYAEGVDVLADTVDLALYLGLIRQNKAWFYMGNADGEEVSYQGRAKVMDALRENPEVYANLQRLVQEAAE